MKKSILTYNQSKKFTKEYIEEGDEYRITVKIRYDDECKNGHNSFAITGDIDRKNSNGRWIEDCGGCIHGDIKKHFPEYAHLIRWHLMSSDEPMHYIANSLYHASSRDHNGLLKGESKQLKDRKTGLPAWHLVAVNKNTGEEGDLYSVNKTIDSIEKPECQYTLEYRPWCRIGEGKTPDLEAARSCAIWPDATLEDFTKEKLKARLPVLRAEFKKDIESLGFIF